MIRTEIDVTTSHVGAKGANLDGVKYATIELVLSL